MKHIYALFALLITSFVSWGQTTTWVKLDNYTDVTEQGTYMIVDVNSSHALTSANGSSSSPSAIDIAITEENSIIGEISEDLQWKFTISDNGYIIKPIANENIHLRYSSNSTSGSNTSLRVGSGSNNIWQFYSQDDYKGFRVFITGTTYRYIGVYNNQDWRGYTSVNNNIENTQIEIFQLVESPTGDHTITVTQANGGEITPSTTGVNNGENASFTATPESSCYVFSHWVVDGVDAGDTNPYTFTNVTADHEITAVFNATASYEILATAGANGTITPSGTTNVNCGAEQIFTFTPDAGYAIADVLVDGVSVGAVTAYTFENVTDNHTITVSFEEYTGPCFTENATNFISTGSTYGGDNDQGTSTIRLASNSNPGAINTSTTGVQAGDVTVRFRAKGWSASEIQVTVTLGDQSQFISNLPTAFDWVEVHFTNVPENPVLSFSTISGKRLHIGNVELICSVPTPALSVNFTPEDLHIEHNINATTPTVAEAIVNIANLTEEFNLSVVSTTEYFVVNTTGALVNGENTIQIQLADGLAAGEYTGSIIVSLGEEILATLPLTGEVVDIPLSTPENAIEGLRIYPNPATDVVFVTSNSGAMKNVQLFDLSGKKVLDVHTTSSFQVNALANGIYVMKVTEEGKTSTSKLIVK